MNKKKEKGITTIVFVYSMSDVINFKKNNKDQKKNLFVLCDASKKEFFKRSSINFIFLEDFTNLESFKEHDRVMYDLANTLFKDFGKYVSYNGINLGNLISYELKAIFSELLFYYKLINPIIKYYNPKKVFVFPNVYLNEDISFRFFKKDLIYEVLSYLKNKNNFSLNFIPKKQYNFKKRIIIKGLKILQILQNSIYKINPYHSKGEKIILSGGIRNLKAFINSSPNSKNFKFHTLLEGDALEFNFSKSFFFLNAAPIFKKKKNQNLFLENYSKIIKNKHFQKNFIFDNEDLFELFKPRLIKIFYYLFPLMCYYYDCLGKFIDKTKPKAVLTISDRSSFERLLMEIANKKKIPTFVTQYGLNSLGSIYGRTQSIDSFWPSKAKYKLVWGKIDEKLFRHFNVKKENIFIVGEPRFYDYKSKISLSREALLRKLGINPNKKIILFTSVYGSFVKKRSYLPGVYLSAKEYKKILQIFVNILSKNPEYHLIISQRPGSEENEFINSIIPPKNMKNVTILNSKEFSPNNRINAADVVVTNWSTTGMEAIILEKILLIYKLRFREDTVGFLKYNAGYGFDKEKELEYLLENLDKLKTKKYLKSQKKYLKDQMEVNKKINSFEKMIEIINKK